MATYTRMMLSGDTHGIGILVVNTTGGAADTVHTATASTTDPGDEVWLWADNPDTSVRTLKIWWGGVTAVTNEKVYVLPALTSDIPLIRGTPLRNSLVVKASCDAANKVSIRGFVNRVAA
jgi:hypothetical protein